MNDTPTAPLFPKGRGREKSEHQTGKAAKWGEIKVKQRHSSGGREPLRESGGQGREQNSFIWGGRWDRW